MLDPDALPPVGALAVPFYLGSLALEALGVRRGWWPGRYVARDTATSLAMGVGSLVSGAIFAGLLLALLMTVYEHRWLDVPVNPATALVAFVLDDLKYYWSHRFGHRIRWVWASHVVHHSSREYNLGTALRQTWTGALSGMVVLGLPLVWLGFHPALIAFVHAINLIYQFWIHTESIRRMPAWFEAVFNTPSHHRVHHGRNPRYLDANYAGVLIVWDRLFGTFVPERDDDPADYGILHDIGTYNPVRVAFHEYVDMARDQAQTGLSLADRFRYLFAPPGWSHDGAREGSEAVKRAYVRAHPESAGQPGLPA